MTQELLEGRTDVRDYGLERLTMLQDGVYAIALTLMALDLRVPEGWRGDIFALLAAERGDLAAYGFSFIMTATYWMRQRRIFGELVRADQALTVITLFILCLVTLIPPAMRVVLAPTVTHGSLAYFLLFVAIGFASAAQWSYAAFIGRLLRTGWTRRTEIDEALRQLVVPCGIAGMGVLWLIGQRGLSWIPLVGIFLLRRPRRRATPVGTPAES